MKLKFNEFEKLIHITDPRIPIGSTKVAIFVLARFKLYPTKSKPFMRNAYWMFEDIKLKNKAVISLFNMVSKEIKMNKRISFKGRRGRFILTKVEQVEC